MERIWARLNEKGRPVARLASAIQAISSSTRELDPSSSLYRGAHSRAPRPSRPRGAAAARNSAGSAQVPGTERPSGVWWVRLREIE